MKSFLINQPIGYVGEDGKVYMTPEFHRALTDLSFNVPSDPGYIDDLPLGNTLARVNNRVSEIIAYLEAHHDAHVDGGVFPYVAP